MSELTSALNTSTSKSPGSDNIPYIFLKKLLQSDFQLNFTKYTILYGLKEFF
jgi:hypothetical protein